MVIEKMKPGTIYKFNYDPTEYSGAFPWYTTLNKRYYLSAYSFLPEVNKWIGLPNGSVVVCLGQVGNSGVQSSYFSFLYKEKVLYASYGVLKYLEEL